MGNDRTLSAVRKVHDGTVQFQRSLWDVSSSGSTKQACTVAVQRLPHPDVTETLFAATKLDLMVWFRAMFHVTQNKRASRRLDVSYSTAWAMPGGPGKTPFVAAVETTRGRQGPPREAAARAAVHEEEHQENHPADRDARCAGCR
jgi:hypothetical protein